MAKNCQNGSHAQYLRVAPNFASTVGNILNVETGYVSPQYHVVHDDFFTTATSLDANNWIEIGGLQAWKCLYELGSERYIAQNDFPVPAQQQEIPSLQRENTDNDSDDNDVPITPALNEDNSAPNIDSDNDAPIPPAPNEDNNAPRSRYGSPFHQPVQYNLSDLNTMKVRLGCLNQMFLNILQWNTYTTTYEEKFFTKH